MNLNLHDNTVHERKVQCTIDQEDLKQILAKHVAAQATFDLDAPGAKFEVFISESNRGGLGSTRYNAEVKLIQDLRPQLPRPF